MKTNQIPKMNAIPLLDKDGEKVYVDIKAFQYLDKTHVFMADQAGVGTGSIARNGSHYICQIIERFSFDPLACVFYRHVYKPLNGSLFGRFNLQWHNGELQNYTFTMLNHLDHGRALESMLAKAEPVAFSYAQIKNFAVAV